MKKRLKKDIIIPKGTIFNCVDDETREYRNGNFSTTFGLTKDSCGELIYGLDENDIYLDYWFEEIG